MRILAAEKDPACILDGQGVFLFVNDAWDRLTGGSQTSEALIGTRWLDQIADGDLRRVHKELFHAALTGRGTGPRGGVRVMGELNTPSLARLVATRMEPIARGEPLGVAVVQTVVRERPIEEVYEAVDRPAEAYRGAAGELSQCPCCLRVKDPAEAGRWDLVPSLVAEPPAGARPVVCELCAELHLGLPPEDG